MKATSTGNKVLKDVLGNGTFSSVTTLMTNVCNKLKSTYGSDVRIYVVKYRKAAGDYDYLDSCATSTSGKTCDITDSTALKSTLNIIAADLKSQAGCTEATIVN